MYNLNMFDKSKYIKDNIFKRLEKSDTYNSAYNGQVNSLIDQINVDIATSNIDNPDEMSIGWVKFCEVFNKFLENKEKFEKFEINAEKFKTFLAENLEKPINKQEFKSNHVIDTTENAEAKILNLDAEILDLCEEPWEEWLEIPDEVSGLEQYKVVVVKEGEEIISPFSKTNYVAKHDGDFFIDIETEDLFLVKIVK
jgi:hypothetical protein